MDEKFELIKTFYQTIDKTKVKIETKNHGFSYLESFGKIGTLSYSEWKNGIFKYKIENLKNGVFENLLEKHLESKINFCAYFNSEKNNIFCFNLDSFSNDFTNLKITAIFLLKNLLRLKIEPIILKSGHGYHIWVRLEKETENSRLFEFMNNIMDVATFETVCQKVSIKDLQCIFYPRFRADDISIRLFGTHHSVTGEFLSVITRIADDDTVLGVCESWQYFKEYLETCKVSEETFSFAQKEAQKLAGIVR